MEFGTLVKIGIVIYIIYSIKKAFSVAKKEGSNQKSSGWAGKLGDVINNIKEEIEKANQATMAEQTPEQAAGSFWEDIREPSPEKESSSSETISQTVFYETTPVIENEITLPEIPKENHRNYHGNLDKPSLMPTRKNSTSCRFKLKKSDLKKAFIWTEIISKPIGLRDEN